MVRIRITAVTAAAAADWEMRGRWVMAVIILCARVERGRFPIPLLILLVAEVLLLLLLLKEGY
jgi:hypothetical protein